tara:strand:- start:832 stop:1452 length:621 start_codon:yes stop_codon:yes gene_type:complete
MNIKYPLLIPVIGHGATDIIEYPVETIVYNIFSGLIVYNLTVFQRRICLILFSIFHVSQDIPNLIIVDSKIVDSKIVDSKIVNLKYFKYIISALFHKLMIRKPLISKLYFLLIHTPLHYLRIIKTEIKTKEKLGVGILTSIVSMFVTEKLYNTIEDKMGKLWWIFPIIPHIIITNKSKNRYLKFKRHLKLKKYNNIIIKTDKLYVV